MSIPPSDRLPPGIETFTVATRRGGLAVLSREQPRGSAGSADTADASSRSAEGRGDHADRPPPLPPDVVLVPGFTGSKEDFLPLLPLLSDWSCYAIDQAGQYESPDPPGPHTLRGWAEDLLDVAAISQRQVVLVGHSFGGLVCREAVLADPERFAGLVLLDSGPGALPTVHHERLRLLQDAIPTLSMAQIWDAKEALERADGVEEPPAAVQQFLHRRWIASSPAAFSAMAGLLMTTPDRTDELSSSGIPLLVAYGRDDATAWPPGEQQEMAARLGCPVAVIDSAAHSPAVENPAATADVLAGFLRRLPR